MFGAPSTTTSNASTNSDASSHRQGPTIDLLAGAVLTDSTLSLVASERTRRIHYSRTLFSSIGQTAPISSTRVTRFTFWISQVLFLTLAWFSPRAVGVYHVLPVAVHIFLALPGLWSATKCLNVDMLKLLGRENEFWSMTTLNLIQWGAVALAFGPDARVLSCVVESWAVQLVVAVDADLTTVHDGFFTEWMTLSVLIVYFVIIIGRIAHGNSYVQFTIGGQVISAPGLLLWTTPTLVVVLLKNMCIRRRRRPVQQVAVDARSFSAADRIVYCCTIRARLALQKASKKDVARRRRTSVALDSATTSSLLRSHSTLSLIDASNLLHASMDSIIPDDSTSVIRAAALYALAVLSFAGTCIGMIDAEVQESFASPSPRPTFISVAGLIGTLVFAAFTARFYHRDVLVAIMTSFHVVFCILQLVSGGVTMCAMYEWDRRCISVLSGAVWFVWVLAYDALTPPIRQYLRLNKLTMSPLVLFTLYTLGGPLVLIYGYQCDRLHDRVLFTGVQESTLVASRVLTLWLWNARLMWDFGVRDENDLVLLSDLVQLTVPRDLIPARQAVMPLEPVPTGGHARRVST